MNIKSLLLSLTLSACAALPAAAVDLTYNWGNAQVVAEHTVGPGIKYMKVLYPSKPLILWFVEIDLSNEYAKVEQVQSRHQVPDVLRWDVMTHYRENSRPGHQVRVAWNHDFFSYEAGICIGLNVSEGEVTGTKWGRSLLAVTDDGKADVFYPTLDAFVTTADGTSVVIDYYNSPEGGITGDCVLFNRMNAKTLTEDGTYVSLTPIDRWLVNGEPIRCKVNSVGTSPVQTTSDGQMCTLYLRNSKLNALDGHITAGDIVTVTQQFGGGWGNKPRDILNAFHGYPSIVHDGVLHEGEFNNFENGREYEKSSRVMVGVSQDKTKLYVATTEMSTASVGVDCIELSAWLVEHGAWDVVNFDSGGSAAIVIDEEMLNLPGRGSVRPVEDAMLAVSLAPEDNSVDHICFSLKSIMPNAISRTPLRVMSFNKYDEVIENDVADCEFQCVPETIGYVDDEGIFHSSAEGGQGRILARKNGMEAALDVDIQPVNDLAPAYANLLIDDRQHLISGIRGSSAQGTVEIDPGALDWTATPSGIVEIQNGFIKGLANGDAVIIGTFKDISFDINVKVEIAQPKETIADCSDTEKINISTTSPVKNLVYDNSVLPTDWTGGLGMKFDLSTGRGTYIKMTPKMQLYSLPDSISLRVNDPDGIIQNINFTLTDAQGNRISKTIIPDSKTGYCFLSFKDPEDEIEYHRYPLTLNTVSCLLANRSVPGTQLAFGSLDAYYPGYVSSVTDIIADRQIAIDITVSGETLNMTFDDTRDGDRMVCVYDATGRRMLTRRIACKKGRNDVDIDVKYLSKGLYFVTLQGHTLSAGAKVLLK